jgi:peptidoglycan/LPS O-acetylase OafA/YrhL
MISRSNNFDFLRLIFASFVVITHSYPLSGASESDFLSRLTFSQMPFSYMGVKGFFIISGYLIFKSLLRCKNLSDYYWKRVLRLFPALFVVLLLTVLLAPAVYESAIPYWKNSSVYTYIPHNLSLFFLQSKIEGVFENNPYKGSINGSLWTICYEFSMYIMVSLLFFIRQKSFLKAVIILLFISSYALAVFNPYFFSGIFSKIGLGSNNFYDLMCFFTAGMLLTYLNISKKTEILLISAAFIVLIGSIYLKIFGYTCFFTLPVLVILIGKNSTMYINKVGDVLGDISYGVYIYSFPIQQTLMYFFKLDTVPLMIFSLMLSFLLGYLSWHLIEKKALRYKDLVAKKELPQMR